MTDAGEAWTLSTPEFRRLWLDQKGSDYPIDFAYTDAAERSRDADTPEPPLPRLSVPWNAAMRAMTHGIVSISLAVIDARRDFDDTSHHRRVAAGWDGGEFAYVARQKIGAEPSLGGTVSITRHDAASWSREVVADFPSEVRGGELAQDRDVAVEWQSIVEGLTTARVTSTATDTAAHAFTVQTVGHCSTIRIHVGSVDEGRRRTPMLMKVRDIPDDGRYVLVLDDPVVAMPVDSIALAKLLNRVINALRNRHYAEETPA